MTTRNRTGFEGKVRRGHRPKGLLRDLHGANRAFRAARKGIGTPEWLLGGARKLQAWPFLGLYDDLMRIRIAILDLALTALIHPLPPPSCCTAISLLSFHLLRPDSSVTFDASIVGVFNLIPHRLRKPVFEILFEICADCTTYL